jgi:outer membrane murein-binding lipoprotein Lpp
MSFAFVVRIQELEARVADLELVVTKLLAELQATKDSNEEKQPRRKRNPRTDSG